MSRLTLAAVRRAAAELPVVTGLRWIGQRSKERAGSIAAAQGLGPSGRS